MAEPGPASPSTKEMKNSTNKCCGTRTADAQALGQAWREAGAQGRGLSVCLGGRPNVSGPQFIHLQSRGLLTGLRSCNRAQPAQPWPLKQVQDPVFRPPAGAQGPGPHGTDPEAAAWQALVSGWWTQDREPRG